MRTCHSSGCRRWTYKPLYVNKLNEDIDSWIKDIVEEEDNRSGWSEHYRGVEYFIVDTKQVPNSRIQSVCESIKDSIEYAEKSIVANAKHLAEIEGLNGKGRKTDPDEIEAAKRKKKHEAAMEKARKRWKKNED